MVCVLPRGCADNTPYEKVGDAEQVSILDDLPFDIPDTWEWVHVGEIFAHNTGKALNASNRTGQLLPYITTSNLYWNRFAEHKGTGVCDLRISAHASSQFQS